MILPTIVNENLIFYILDVVRGQLKKNGLISLLLGFVSMW